MAIDIKKDNEQNENETIKSHQEPRAGKAPDFEEILASVASTAGMLSSDGNKYVDTLKAQLTDSSELTRIKMIKLTSHGALLFKLDNAGVIVVMTEVLGSGFGDPSLPISICHRDIVKEVEATYPSDFRILKIVDVDELSYYKVKQMVSSIKASLICATAETVTGVTLEGMQAGRYGIDPTITTVTDYVNKKSPHHVPNRVDIGFCLTMKKKGFGDSNDTNYKNRPFTPIGAAGGYVEFLIDTSMTGSGKYLPVIHITEIVCDLPSEHMLSVMKALCSSVFLTNHHWKSQFTSFGKNKPDVGNLFRDQNGQPITISNIQERDMYFRDYMHSPILVIDITEGRDRIPGLEKYADPKYAGSLLKSLENFLGVSINVQEIGHVEWQEVIGTVAKGSDIYDSRNVDYLALMNHGGIERIEDFIYRYPDVNARANVIQQIFGVENFRRLYYNHCLLLEPEFVNIISSAVNSYLDVRSSIVNTQSMDVSNLTSIAKSYAQRPPVSVISNFGRATGPRLNYPIL